MLLQRTFVAVAAFALAANASNPFPKPKDFCCIVTDAISKFHEKSAATAFCSSYLSIKTKTATTTKTVTSSKSTAKVVTTTKTITPSNTITATLTRTVGSGTKATVTTVPTSITVTSTQTITSVVTTSTTQTSTTTTTASVTSFSTVTSTTASVSVTTSTTTVLDPNFMCFTSSTPRVPKRGVSNNAQSLNWLKGIIPQKISSACSCLSLTTPTKSVTATSTIVKTTASSSTVTSTVTAQSVVFTSTTYTSVTTPATTSASTAFSTATSSTTTTTVTSTTSVIVASETKTVTSSTTSVSITTSFVTSASVSTATATVSVGSQLQFRVTTNRGQSYSGPDLYAAAAVSSPPFNFFYFRTQGDSGTTTYRLDDNCQLFEDFAGVYAQMKPADPNPGTVYSGSGVPVTCQIDVDTNQLDCANPAGGDQTFLCDTQFGVNSYPIWWLGNDNSPGSRCEARNIFAAFTL